MGIIAVPKDRRLVRVLDISQLFKEHITDLLIAANRKAAEKGFSEDVFDIFGYVDHRDNAHLRLEPKSIEEQIDLGATSVLNGACPMPYRDVTPKLLRAFDAGHLCLARHFEMELLVNAPIDMRQFPRFTILSEQWCKENKEEHNDSHHQR